MSPAAASAAIPRAPATVLALHHEYRVAGGEEAAAKALAQLAELELGERVAWLRRDSSTLGARIAARGLLRGGLDPAQITQALAGSGADLLHAHNLFPTFGPRAIEAAASAGAATVVHLHNSRLVCAVAVNVRDGAPCQQCSARWPAPGVLHRCRGSLPEATVYAAALPRWRSEVLAAADAVIVPSASAAQRLRAMGVALPSGRTHVIGGVAPDIAASSSASSGRYALVAGRLAPEKDLATAISATAIAGLPLVVAGDGPERGRLEQLAATAGGPPADPASLLGDALATSLSEPTTASGKYVAGQGQLSTRGHVVFTGRVSAENLSALRSGARIAIVPSLAPETFGLAALEAMATALPTVGSAVGALPELLGEDAVVAPGDQGALADALRRLAGDEAAGLAAAARAARLAAPRVVADRLAAAYAQARARRDQRLAR